jgi:ribosomal protein L7/L12
MNNKEKIKVLKNYRNILGVKLGKMVSSNSIKKAHDELDKINKWIEELESEVK